MENLTKAVRQLEYTLTVTVRVRKPDSMEFVQGEDWLRVSKVAKEVSSELRKSGMDVDVKAKTPEDRIY